MCCFRFEYYKNNKKDVTNTPEWSSGYSFIDHVYRRCTHKELNFNEREKNSNLNFKISLTFEFVFSVTCLIEISYRTTFNRAHLFGEREMCAQTERVTRGNRIDGLG